MSQIKNITLAGVTGTLGPAILRALQTSPSKFNISILTRSASTPPSLPPTIKVIQTDYTLSSLISSLSGQDALISTLGAPATMTQTLLIDAAIAAGVKLFIPSDFAPYSPDLSEIERVVPELGVRLKPKAAIIDYLNAKAADHPEFSWCAVGSGPLFDWTLKTSFLGTSLPLRTSTIIDSGTTPYLTTTSVQIGRAIVSILSSFPSPSIMNKYLLISSFTTTQLSVLATCEKVTGQKFTAEHVSAEERGREGREMLTKGDFRGIGRLWNVWGHADVTEGEGREILRRELANEMLGLPVERMEDVVREMVDG